MKDLKVRLKTASLLSWIGVWALFALLFGFVGATLFRPPYDELVTSGVVVEGWIIGKEPDNHQNVHYSYIVGSHTYSGIGHGGQAGIPSFEMVQIGQKVRVVYHKGSPAVSSLGDPALHLRSANLLTGSMSVLLSTFVTAVLWLKTRPKK
ncbi:MAG: hypothetical protein ACREBC_06750 [Pyrinomonadaceae bacterium]